MEVYQKAVLTDNLKSGVYHNSCLQRLTLIWKILVFIVPVFFNKALLYSQGAPDPPEIISVSVEPGSDSVTMRWKKISSNYKGFIISQYQFQNEHHQVVPGTQQQVNDSTLEEYTFPFPLVKKRSVPFTIEALNNPGMINEHPHRTIYTTFVWDSCNSTIHMKWTKYVGWGNELNYQVYSELNGVPKMEASIPDTFHSFKVEANRNYRFYVVATKNATSITSRSNDTILYTKQSIPPEYIRAKGTIFKGNAVDLAFEIDPASEISKYQLYYSGEPDGDYKLLKEFEGYAGKTILTYTDVLPALLPRYYILSAVNNCGLPVVSSNKTTAIVPALSVKDNTINIQWNKFIDWSHGNVLYDVFRSIDGSENPLTPQTNNNFFQDDIRPLIGQNYPGDICYYIRASTNEINPQLFARSATVCVDLSEQVFIPNAVRLSSPKDENRFFKPYFAFLPSSFTMIIYDRYGYKIFETNDLSDSWNGTVYGKKATEGTYIYFIRFSSQNGKTIEKKGNFSVIY